MTLPPATATVPFRALLTSAAVKIGPCECVTIMLHRRPLVANIVPVTV